MNIDLKDRNALVCGSTRGIGRASAIGLAAAGARVTLLARDPKTLRKTLEELAGEGHDAISADFSRPEEVRQAVERHLQETGKKYSILVNNTGGPPAGPLADAGPDAFRKGFEMHVINNQLLVRALLPGMRSLQYGRIINIISTSVKTPLKNLGVSNTIRGAVASWAKTLASELGPYGITVNNVLPGFTETERLFDLILKYAERSGHTPEEEASAMKEAVPARRFARPEEIAHAVVFLASPQAAYINGINLPVDGGRTPAL